MIRSLVHPRRPGQLLQIKETKKLIKKNLENVEVIV